MRVVFFAQFITRQEIQQRKNAILKTCNNEHDSTTEMPQLNCAIVFRTTPFYSSLFTVAKGRFDIFTDVLTGHLFLRKKEEKTARHLQRWLGHRSP